LAIVVPYAHGGVSFVHAVGPGAPNMVRENRLMPPMRLVRNYAIPGVA
jgi:hypothetical protein